MLAIARSWRFESSSGHQFPISDVYSVNGRLWTPSRQPDRPASAPTARPRDHPVYARGNRAPSSLAYQKSCGRAVGCACHRAEGQRVATLAYDHAGFAERRERDAPCSRQSRPQDEACTGRKGAALSPCRHSDPSIRLRDEIVIGRIDRDERDAPGSCEPRHLPELAGGDIPAPDRDARAGVRPVRDRAVMNGRARPSAPARSGTVRSTLSAMTGSMPASSSPPRA